MEAVKLQRSNIFLLALLTIAVPVISYLTSNDFKTGVLILFAIFGLTLAVVCFNSARMGFYITITTVMTIRFFERMYGQEVQVGLALDTMLFSAVLGTLLKKNRKTENPVNYFKEPLLLLLYLQFIYYFLEGFNPMAPGKDTLVVFMRILLRYLLFAILTTMVLKTKKDIYTFFKFWLGLSTVTAVYGCIQEWFGLPPWEMAYMLSTPEKMATTMIDGHLRVSSTMSDPAVYGIMMAATSVMLLILLSASARVISWGKKSLILLSLLFHLMALGYSGTRTGYVMIPAGLFLFLLVNIHKRNTIIAAMLFTIIGGGILFGPFYGNATLNRVRTAFIGTQDASLNVREINRHSVQPFMYSHPFGGGLFTVGGEGTSYNPGHPLAGFPPDSGLVRIVLEMGWIMLIIVLIFHFIQMSTCIGNYFRFTDELDKLLAISGVSMVFAVVISMYAQETGGLMETAIFMNAMTGVIVKSKYL